jgi:acetyltransferase-like isoleucine patch superfamily enzyme
MPKVSIIIPAFNAAATIIETLKSTQSQEFQDFEIIVVDDGSTDATVEVVRREFPDVRVIQQENTGPAAARNHGVAEAQGEWLAFLDADDTWLPWRLSLQLELAKQCPGAVMFCGLTVDLDDDNGLTPPTTPPSTSMLDIKSFVIGNPVATTTVLLKKSTFDQAGGFDTLFRGPEDYELWMRIAKIGEIYKIWVPLCRYRCEMGSLSMDDGKFLPQVLAVLDKAYGQDGVLRPHGRKSRAKAQQYSSASWMAFCQGNRLRALKHLMLSFMNWPFPTKNPGSKPLLRLQLLIRYLKPAAPPQKESEKGRAQYLQYKRLWNEMGADGVYHVVPRWKRLAKRLLCSRLPLPNFGYACYRKVYRILDLTVELFRTFKKIVWVEPVMRGLCKSVGKNLRIERVPDVYGNGSIELGSNVYLSGHISFAFNDKLKLSPAFKLGDNCFIGHLCAFNMASGITIGDNCLISGQTVFYDNDGHPTDADERRKNFPVSPESVKPIVVGDDVWIGRGCMILKGVHIGDRAIIGAGSVVVRDVPADTVVAGNPAQVRKQLL